MSENIDKKFATLIVALEDENYHDEAEIIELIQSKIMYGSKLVLSENESDVIMIREEKPVVPVVEEKEPVLPKGIEKVVVYKMDWNVLEDLVETEFGVPYNFVAATECPNDSSHEFRVSKIDDEDIEEVKNQIMNKVDRTKELIASKGDSYSRYELYYNPETLLDYLSTKNIIPEGEYIIGVSY